MLRTRFQNILLEPVEALNIVDDALFQAMHANCIAIHWVLGLSPGFIVFNHNMILDILLIVGLEWVRERRQVIIDEQLQKQNAKRVAKDYQSGKQVLKIVLGFVLEFFEILLICL